MENPEDKRNSLEMKRLEADTLRDLMRAVNNPELSVARMSIVTRNALRMQWGVKKMLFRYEVDFVWMEECQLGFGNTTESVVYELHQIHLLRKIFSEEFPELHAWGAEYVVPININGLTKAYFIVAEFVDSEEEAQDELIFIETIGHILYAAIQNKNFYEQHLKQVALRQELTFAKQMQQQLLLSEFHRFSEIDVHAINLPYQEVGGDFYDVIKRGKGTTFVCIADVAGKGMSAALIMSNIQANLRALCANHDDVEQIGKELNRLVLKATKGEKFVTFFLAKIDTRKKEVTYLNAGHNYPILIQPKGITQLHSQSIPLGLMPSIEVAADSFAYEPGDNLFMYTDGLTDQTDKNGVVFDEAHIIETLTPALHKSSQDIINIFREAFQHFTEGSTSVDDLTLMNVRFI